VWIIDSNQKTCSNSFFKDRKIEIINFDFKNPTKSNELIKKIRPDIVYHLASNLTRTLDIDNYKLLLEENYIPTLHLFTSLLKHSSVKQVIFMGTCEEYGQKKKPFTENMCTDPTTPYSLYKTFCTSLSLMLYKYEHFPVVILRPTITYGPYQNPNMFIPSLIINSLLKKPFPMTHGEQKRDFLYVDDLVDVLVLVGISNTMAGEIINIGSGHVAKIKDAAQTISELNNNENYAQIGTLPYRDSEIMSYITDTKKAKKLLNWEAKISLKDGLTKTFDWYKKNIRLYK